MFSNDKRKCIVYMVYWLLKDHLMVEYDKNIFLVSAKRILRIIYRTDSFISGSWIRYLIDLSEKVMIKYFPREWCCGDVVSAHHSVLPTFSSLGRTINDWIDIFWWDSHLQPQPYQISYRSPRGLAPTTSGVCSESPSYPLTPMSCWGPTRWRSSTCTSSAVTT